MTLTGSARVRDRHPGSGCKFAYGMGAPAPKLRLFATDGVGRLGNGHIIIAVNHHVQGRALG